MDEGFGTKRTMIMGWGFGVDNSEWTLAYEQLIYRTVCYKNSSRWKDSELDFIQNSNRIFLLPFLFLNWNEFLLQLKNDDCTLWFSTDEFSMLCRENIIDNWFSLEKKYGSQRRYPCNMRLSQGQRNLISNIVPESLFWPIYIQCKNENEQ